MSRDLTAGTTTEKNKASTIPINIIKIEFGGAIGDKYYSDRALTSPVTAESRVTEWGSLGMLLREKAANPIGNLEISLEDTNKTLLGYMDDVEFQTKRVTFYQWFSGLVQGDMLPLMIGKISPPVKWDEKEATLVFDVEDISTLYDKDIGSIASADDFTYVSKKARDKMLPLVYGKVRRNPAMKVKEGVRTQLVRRISTTDMSFFVEDSSEFPQDQEINVRIGYEEVTGSFHGNTFTITERAPAAVSSRTTHATGQYDRIRDTTLPETQDDAYAGRLLATFIGPFITKRRIVRYLGGDLKTVVYSPPYSIGTIQSGGEIEVVPQHIPAGTAYWITTAISAHKVGEEVVHVMDDYVYIANDAPSKAITNVEVWGVKERVADVGDQSTIQEREDYITVDPMYYTVNLNDTTTFPALGRAVTTITFKHNPKEILGEFYKKNDVYCDIEGIDSASDGTGTLLENPVDVIDDILRNHMGLTDSDIDTASFSAVQTLVNFLQFGFALTTQKKGMDLVADLAYQARCSLIWEAGKAKMKFLYNKGEASAATISTSEIQLDTLSRAWSSIEEVVTEINATYTLQNEKRNVVVKDAVAEAAYERKVQDLSLWAYANRSDVVSIATFRLNRWAHIYEELSFSTFLTSLEVERGDTITLNVPAHYSAGQKGYVTSVRHEGGSGTKGKMDTIQIESRLPIWAGCATTCEANCETGCESTCEIACESGCETDCQTTCEGDCQSICQLACTSACENVCTTLWQISVSGPCSVNCETSCESASCQIGACQTGSCESGQETEGCYQSCETCGESGNCQTSCVTSGCESGCTSSCVAGIEPEGCPESCVTSCVANCQACTNCDACQACDTSQAGGCDSCQTCEVGGG